MSKIYVLLDAMNIQSYIFETNTLKIILGSSLALARWQEGCKILCGQNGGEILASAGGNVLARFDNESQAKSFRKICTEDSDIVPPGVDIAWAEAAEKTSELETWEELQEKLVRYKIGDIDAKDYLALVSIGLPGCFHCGIRPKDGLGKVDEREICNVCRELHKMGGELQNQADKGGKTSIEALYKLPLSVGFDQTFPVDMAKMVARSNGEKDLLAVVVIDLNDMGNRIKDVIQKQGFNGFRSFSAKLVEDVCKVFKDVVTGVSKKPGGFVAEQFIRLRPLLLAGDDAVFAMPAPLWPDFVTDSVQRLKIKGYPACAGVVVAKDTYPITRLVQMAEELVQSAKGLARYLKKEEPSFYDCAVDWHVHQESSFASPFEVRRRNYLLTVQENLRYEIATKRPYTLSDFLQLKEMTAQLSKLSNRKLFALYRGLRRGTAATRDMLAYVFLRDENNDFDKYSFLWDRVCDINGEYPLWEKTSFTRGQYNPELHDTYITDLLELKWFLDKPTEGGDI